MRDTNIRKANADDCSSISRLIQRSVRVINSADYSPETIELICLNFSEDMVIKKMLERDVFVCEFNEKLLGTISLGGNKLHSLFVDPEYQRHGIGTNLVLHLEQFAKLKKISQIYLSSSITAKPFYQRLGYNLLRFEKRPDGSTYLMQKEIR